MDFASIAAVQQSVKALFGLTKVTLGAVVDHEVKARLIEIQQGILDVQEKLGDAHADRMQLLDEVTQLRDKLRAMEAAKAALDAYEMHELQPGLIVFRSKPDAGHALEHFACPRCHASGSVALLQSAKWSETQVRWLCSVCSFALVSGPAAPRRLQRRVTVPRDW